MQSPETPKTTKKVTLKASVQRLWDAEVLAGYRERLATNAEFMAHHREQEARGEEIWVDCHHETISWISDGVILVRGQQYTVGLVEDGYHLRCSCRGCSMDMAYCRRNHQLRLSDFVYDRLRRKVKAAQVPDGAVVRFHVAVNVGGMGKQDTFRKGQLTHRARNARGKETSTVFFSPLTNTPCRIVRWQDLDYDVLSLPDAAHNPDADATP